ncbi:leucyl/phenylalanyl-tRNA--protein transferase [Aeromonas molluscorum 848]|uniref:Leucyl/phenylalanyl-tRNA--protein transferase n=1 Tax=Aeromonas molluscorum 848 TaxID=1268236 RepID=R1F1F7_9GAMM|nr:leucyl/phenylalanyl-tRNA--protein transferase [Aeromonas molluscorum 848]
MSCYLTQLDDEPTRFPHPKHALDEPNGLLAIGGDLSPPRLLAAYHNGIFPWNEPHQALLWWSPDPRGVIVPSRLHVGRSLKKFLRRHSFDISINRAFNQVIAACAAPRPTASGTWISDEMIAAYQALHRQGHAHSIEVWQDGQLQAGLYGIAVGRLFCGESMFSRIDNGAKVAMWALCRHFECHAGPSLTARCKTASWLPWASKSGPVASFWRRWRHCDSNHCVKDAGKRGPSTYD